MMQAEQRKLYSEVKPGTVTDLDVSEADCFLVHAFAVVEAEPVRAILKEQM